MIHEVSAALVEEGIAQSKIHFELFTASTPILPTQEKAKSTPGVRTQATIILDHEETHFDMSSKEFILDAALDAGADVPYACKGAVCCTCRAKVLEGEVEMAMNYSLTDQELADGYVLTCQAMPRSPKVVVSYDEN